MSRMPRKGRPPVPRYNDSLNRFKQAIKTKGSSGIKVSHSPLSKPRSKEKRVVNRSCYASPCKRNFGQYFTSSSIEDMGQVTHRTDHNQYVTQLQDQYDAGPAIPNITHVKKLKKVPCDTRNKFKTGQRSDNLPNFEDESYWQNLDNAEEVDKTITSSESSDSEFPSKKIFISKAPRVKVIAEKFSKYKRGNLELRRLDEKVVCVEYDIFKQPAYEEVLKPRQRMRAFFSIKPHDNDSHAEGLPTLPPHIKNEFVVVDEDLQKLTEKEIEFIDCKIEENQSYLEDLRRILKRKHMLKARKNKTSLDLLSLYVMAKEDKRPLNCENLLSKAELKDVKDLILQQCRSSVHGFSRKTIKRKDNGLAMDPSVISEIIKSNFDKYV